MFVDEMDKLEDNEDVNVIMDILREIIRTEDDVSSRKRRARFFVDQMTDVWIRACLCISYTLHAIAPNLV